MLTPGLYEQVINNEISGELSAIPEARRSSAPIDPAEASKILSQYLAEVVQKGLDNVADNGGDVNTQVALVNRLVSLVGQQTEEASFAELAVDRSAEQLLALMAEKDPRLAVGKTAKDMERPETSLAQSSLFTGAVHEPQMYSELKKEIRGADRIDMLVSFIRWSGLRLIYDELRDFTENGGVLRVISTTYMGATDIKAVQELSKLSNTYIRISYDTKRTRLHAKSYVFYRNSGFTTAYVGSSNLSNAAMSSGLEWNVKVTAKDLPETIQKITATFDSYWNSPDFVPYTSVDLPRLEKALDAEQHHGSEPDIHYFFDIHPYPYQQEILDELTAEREIRGSYRNLVVAATGTGKTSISAFDYRRFKRANEGKPCRLLFVAHREEILKQSRFTFQGVLKDPNFGELYVGNSHPENLEHLFISVQTLNSQRLYDQLPEDYYDYIVVDEFHHAAAPTYQKLLKTFKPKILLGLTATPERMDGKNILDYFGGRIAAEIRLPEAIDRKLLCPFQYFGVSDTIDLDELKWTKGGYEKSELTRVYALTPKIAERRADHIINSLNHYVTDLNKVKGLGFCVSVEHARFMADFFNSRGIPSLCLTGGSSDEDRSTAKKRLIAGELRFIFVVDLYNEGVDIPEVNTVLFLRPTESLTIFLQQLGRGLRLAEGKECLTVLDFIGQANQKYNFEEKFSALLSGTRNVSGEVKKGFVSAPKGCYIQLEKRAREIILDNIKKHFTNLKAIIARIEDFEEDSGLPLNLENFLTYHHLSSSAIYGKYSFARLCVTAGKREDFDEPAEEALTKAFRRIISIDSLKWIDFLLELLPRLNTVELSALSTTERQMLQMFCVTVWQKTADGANRDEVLNNLRDLAHSPVMLAELTELLKYNRNHIDFVGQPADLGFSCPLETHCTYTRDQLLVALDYMTPGNVREGVKWLPEKKLDVLFVTLNKSDKDYSPTTMYNDYSINERLFHWQSQSTTAETSSTGKRYINHKSMGTQVLLAVREYKNDSTGAAPYTLLGPVTYDRHNGSRPMNVTWRLDQPIPAKYLKKTNNLAAG